MVFFGFPMGRKASNVRVLASRVAWRRDSACALTSDGDRPSSSKGVGGGEGGKYLPYGSDGFWRTVVVFLLVQ